MGDNTFFTVNAKIPENPLEHLKILHAKFSREKPGGMEDIYLKKFVNFAEAIIQRGTIDYLLMANSGDTKDTAGLLLVNFGTSQTLAQDMVPELYNNLYELVELPKPSIDQVYFNYTAIPGIWEWWEKRETKQESFGTVQYDQLIGFVHVGL